MRNSGLSLFTHINLQVNVSNLISKSPNLMKNRRYTITISN